VCAERPESSGVWPDDWVLLHSAPPWAWLVSCAHSLGESTAAMRRDAHALGPGCWLERGPSHALLWAGRLYDTWAARMRRQGTQVCVS
jgi:hypothetical protein